MTIIQEHIFIKFCLPSYILIAAKIVFPFAEEEAYIRRFLDNICSNPDVLINESVQDINDTNLKQLNI